MYARIIRYVERIPLPNTIALWFPKSNVLYIDKEHWARIDDMTREQVFRTQERTLEIYYPLNRPPRVTPRSKPDGS